MNRPHPFLLRGKTFESDVLTFDQFDNASGDDKPAFLYHLGDMVYFNGEWDKYYRQFFNAYNHYTAPLFAIPGNHDGLPLTQKDTSGSGIGTFVTDVPV